MLDSRPLRRTALFGVLALVTALAVPATASAADYVLLGPTWGASQNAAVEAAGGTVTFGHGPTGIGVASSDAPDFLERVLASPAIHSGNLDFEVQWQPEVQTVTPADETFFGFQWNMLAMEAPAAWATGCTGAGVRVAVIDGGFDDDHVDLDDNFDSACSVSFEPGVPFNQDTGTFWHGTHVAGIVAAEDNGLGVIGVAPEATLVGVKVLHDGSGPFSQIIAGILYSADPAAFGNGHCQRADIINMSLAGVLPRSCRFGEDIFPGACADLLTGVTKAVNFATSQGVLVVSAAGNDGLDFGQLQDVTISPAEAGAGIAVAATGPTFFSDGGTNYRRFASYSNWGEDLVNVAAPGGDFVTFFQGNPLWFLDMVLSTNVNDVYTWTAGTSMASPAAAGVAALIKSTNPGMSVAQLKAKLFQTADDEGRVGNDELYGHGFVNAFRGCTE